MSNIYDDLEDGPFYTASFLQPLPTAVGRIANVGFRPLSNYTYKIVKIGSTYYRRDGTDGEIDDSNSNFGTLFNNTVTDLGSSGGKIALGQGTFSSTAALTQTAQVSICGENLAATVLDFSSGTSDGITTTAGAKRWMHLSDLTIKTNDHIGIKWQNISQSSIERVRLLNCSEGIKLSGNDGTASGAIWNTLKHVLVDNPSDAGIRLTGVSGNGQANGNWIQAYIYNLQGGAPVASSIGIDVDVGDSNIIFGHVQQVDYGLRFDESSYNLCYYVPDRVTAFTDEITFLAGSSENKVYGENISSNITAGGTNNKVFDDITYYESAAAFANPSVGPLWSGRTTVFEETTGGTTRLYWYDSAGWHYVNQTA